MTSSEIRSRFLSFFEKRGHAVIPSASLITPDQKGVINSTLFNTAGMQPLIPYLLGEIHPKGSRLVDVQKCIRTIDIDDIGDKTHATFFEMLGNWSLGDYFKKEAITWSYEFLTSKKEGLGLDPKRLYITVFEGDENAKKDTESAEIWKSVGISENRIYYKNASSNWWPAVKGKDIWTGPTGPCSEMFYDLTKEGLGDLREENFEKAESDQKVVEIWNDVFMEFEKVEGKIIANLSKKNVDTGAGFERLCMVMQGVDNIYDTDLFKPVMDKIKKLSKPESWDVVAARIIADHIKASMFLISDGVIPSKDDRGYVLRKLIRRSIRKQKEIQLDISNLSELIPDFIEIYIDTPYHSKLKKQEEIIKKMISDESKNFIKVLHAGDIHIADILRKAQIENRDITGKESFALFSSYGFPIEETVKIAKSKDIKVDVTAFEAEFKSHQSLSRSGAGQKFKGGLANSNDPIIIKYHTTTHLLHQALHDVLGENDGSQKGSNITTERLRFDFTYGSKLTDDQKKKVEDIVNKKISESLPVQNIIMPKKEAEKTGARHFFGEKYGEEISIYFIGKDLDSAYSKEFCGGPHVKNTNELGHFKIIKEEAVSQGIRRIKAILQ